MRSDIAGFRRACLLLSAFTLTLFAVRAGAEELPAFAGFTRPGYPSDLVTGDKVVFASDNKEQAMGGTVYFTVLQRTGASADDPWGTGVEKFTSSFRPGIDFNGASSPEFDTGARYLYLYQVVNDRRTTTPIESASVKILGEMKEITSWGYFNGFGFGVPVEKEKGKAIKAVSFNNVLAEADAQKAYLQKAPPVKVSERPRLVPVPTKRGEQPAEDKGRIVSVMWDALDPALAPDFVMMLSSSDFDGRPSFRAIWSNKNAIPKDGRSVAFGFTSNQPPTFEDVRMRTTREASSGIKLVADEPGLKGTVEAVALADGKVPTPEPVTPASLEASGPPPAGGMPPAPQGGGGGLGGFVGGGGGGMPIGVTAGAIGQARGLGSGGGSGSGSGGSDAGQNQQENANQKINFNATLNNQQAQAQHQHQHQHQGQHQHNGGGHGHHPVPEPATLITLGLGVPLLVWMKRRKGNVRSGEGVS